MSKSRFGTYLVVRLATRLSLSLLLTVPAYQATMNFGESDRSLSSAADSRGRKSEHCRAVALMTLEPRGIISKDFGNN